MKFFIKTLSFTSALFLSLFIFSCSNFMSGSNVADELEEIIKYANAPSFTVTIAADKSEYGSLVSSPSVTGCKVTDTIPLEFNLAEGYKFLEWTAICKNDRNTSLMDFVEFEDVHELKTSVKIKDENDSIYSDELLIKPKIVPLLAITSSSTPIIENNAVASRDVSPILKFTAPLYRSNSFSGITISLSNPPEDGANYFRTPEIQESDAKNLIIQSNPENRIPVTKGTSRTVTIKIPSQIIYETDEGNQTSGSELTYTYTIDHSTSSKTNIVYSFSDANGSTNLGSTTLVLEGQSNLTFSKQYNIGETTNIAFRIDPNYSFTSWTNSNTNSVIIGPVKNSVGENLYKGANGYLDTDNNIAYATVTVINSAEENVQIKANCNIIPKNTINFSLGSTNLGNTNLLIGGQSGLSFQKTSAIGDSYTVACRIDENYSFTNWSNSNPEAVTIEPVKNSVGENLYKGVNGYLDTDNNIAYATVTVIDIAEEAIEIKANCNIIPKNTVNFSLGSTSGSTNLGNTTLLINGQSGVSFQKISVIGDSYTVACRIDENYAFVNWTNSNPNAVVIGPVKNSVGENLYKGAEGYLDTDNNIAYATVTVINSAEEAIEIKANCGLIPKNTINFSFEDTSGNTNLGSTTLLLEGQSGLNFQKVYNVGDSFTVGCRIDEAYSFSEWISSDTEAITISPVKNNYGENLYSDNNGYFDSANRTAYAVVTLNSKSDEEINIKANCQLIPTVSVVFDGSQGRITPAETKTYKKGEKISVNFISDTDYYFTHWIIKQDGADITNRINFHNEDGSVITQTADIEKAREKSNIIISWNENTNSNIKIIPVCAERPQYLSNGPTGDDIYRDSRVQLMFDQNMDSGSIYFNTDEITNLENSLGISDSAFLTTTYNNTTQKYGYTYNGYVYFKNIEITNKSSGKSILNHFNAPEIQGDTLIIKAKSRNQETLVDEAPPAFSQIVVKISQDFYYSIPKTTNSETDFYKIPLSSSKKWSYSVNSSTDNIAPTFDIGINSTGGDTGFLKLKHSLSDSLDSLQPQTPDQRSGNSNYVANTNYRPNNTLANNTNYYTADNKLYIYARVNDTGIGPSKDLTAFLYKIRDENYTDLTNGIYYTKNIPLNKSSSSLSLAGSLNNDTGVITPYEVDISDLPSGFYKIVFKASDDVGNEKYSYRIYNNLNEPSDNYFYFYWVLIDKTGPVITNTSASSTDTSITFTWTPPAATDLNFSTYSLYNGSTQVTSNVVWKDSNGSTTTATDSNACSCTISGLTKATSYNYTIKTKDTYGNENTYNIPFNTLPNDLTSFSVSTSYSTTNSIRLSWSAPSSKATTKGTGGIKVYYSTSSSGPFTTYKTSDTSPVTISNLSTGTHYYFKAFYTDGYGSESTSSLTTNTYTLPGSVSNFRVTNTSKNSITVSWSAPSGGVSGYRVYYKLSSAASYSVTSTTSTSYSISGLTAGSKYNIYVAPYVYSTSYMGASSSTITQYTKPDEVYAASGKQLLEANSISGESLSYTLNWAFPNSGITGFHIYHSTTNSIAGANKVDYWKPSHSSRSYSYSTTSSTGKNYIWLVNYIGEEPSVNQVRGTATVDGSKTNFTATLINPDGMVTNTIAAPSNISIPTVASNYLYVTWTKPSSCTGVRIYYSSSNSSSYTYYSSFTGTTGYIYLNAATRYTLKLVPYIGNNTLYSESINSNTITETTKCNIPASLTVAEASTNSITITWTAPSSGAGQGVIYGHCTSGNTSDLNYDNWKYHSASSTGFTISGLTPGTLYYIGVADWLDSGTSMNHVKGTDTSIRTASEIKWITVYTKPYDPNFSVTSTSTGTIKVTLYAPTSGNYSGYYIFYGKNSECSGIGNSTYHQCVTTATSTVTISGLSSNTSYRVWAIPYIGSTSGGYSVIKAIGSPSYSYWNYNYPYWGKDVTTK
ncbi:MAG: fibronectin type III domain-containing protein [Treponema sp.]|nr:fibronectin type III domain-containing protein [Treponema sp.]